MAEQGPAATFHLLEVPTHPLGTERVLRHFQQVKRSYRSPKTIDAYMKKVPSSTGGTMAEQGLAAAFHLLKVLICPLGTEGELRHLQQVKCSNTTPKTIDAYMRKVPSSTSGTMTEQGLAAAFHLLEVPTHPLGTERVLRHLQEVKCSYTSPKTIDAYMRKGA
jgi:hypothetical protein